MGWSWDGQTLNNWWKPTGLLFDEKMENSKEDDSSLHKNVFLHLYNFATGFIGLIPDWMSLELCNPCMIMRNWAIVTFDLFILYNLHPTTTVHICRMHVVTLVHLCFARFYLNKVVETVLCIHTRNRFQNSNMKYNWCLHSHSIPLPDRYSDMKYHRYWSSIP